MDIALNNLLDAPKAEKIDVICPYLSALGFKGWICNGVIYIAEDLFRIELEITEPKMVVREKCKGDRKRRYRSYKQILRELQNLAEAYNDIN